ncbi:MAG: tetratricopeptide repeat protein [Ornithinimicrobium sp.]|uniref:tetratricopeptide repeat protein n=1 Tax=Ornithinimicrobium sp. TaxID=1977084 RepID=UPI003D9BFCF4
MTQQPFSNAALRGAVDLSGLGKAPAAARPGAGPATSGAGTASDAGLTQATDASFEAVVKGSSTVPTVLVLWTAQVPDSLQHAEALAALSRDYEGRFVVVGVDLGANPGIMQALTPVLQQTFGQIDSLPVVLGLIQGQPMPFYLGVQDIAQLQPLFDQFLQAAATNGVTGRADVGADEEEVADEEAPDELPPLHQSAFEAIERGDLDAARTAYEQALAQDPSDADARLGLGQVELLTRTQGLDPAATREAAAQRPGDVPAQIAAADLDVVGGHVEDAFARMIDTVRVTAGEERNQAREHLLRLFEVVGTQDPRVATARRALTNALF